MMIIPSFPKLPPWPPRYVSPKEYEEGVNQFLDAMPEFVENVNKLISILNRQDEPKADGKDFADEVGFNVFEDYKKDGE